MGKILGGHVLAKYLREHLKISTVFGLCGGHIDCILDGLFEYNIRAIDVRHEQSAVMMAQAWSIYGNHPGVALLTAGPGFTNGITGLINAYLDSVPLILISGTAPVRDIDKGALQDINQQDMVKSYVKWSAKCMDIARIPEYLHSAFRIAISGRPGPVFLEFPPDVLNKKIDISEINFPPPPKKHLPAGNPELIKQAAHLINSAKRPFLIGGSGVGFSDCEKELKKLVEMANIPFVLANSGRGRLPDDHPYSIWDGGQTGILTALSQADVVISLGIRYNWLFFYGQSFPQAKHIRVDIEPSEIDRNRTSDIGIAGDVGYVLKELIKHIEPINRQDYIKQLKESYYQLIGEEIENRNNSRYPIHPARMVELVRTFAPKDSIFIADGGDISYFALMGLRANSKAGVLGAASGLFGCLGTGLPFGIAAKLAQPDKEVFVINGDGSFGFNAMEFDTAIRHNVKIICVISNDKGWGMIKHGQKLNYGPERTCCSTLRAAHYEKIVEALGGHGEFVTREDELNSAIKKALKTDLPTCINVLVDDTVTSPATLLFADSLKEQ